MKKVRRPVIKSKQSRLQKKKIQDGLAKGDNTAIAEALRRAGV